ncbi:MAG TPA: Rho termination factor N-terminal domain-containing protein [Beutenbergiaceae bacterium]|nr:Rho termination factor N-terminal domain-containing protein [Beutenbergiaceae bacterium]
MTESQDQASAAALTAMKLPQLQAIASQLGLKGTSRLRKGELIEAIKAHGDAPGQTAQGEGRSAAKSAPKQRSAGKASASAPTESAPADEGGSGKGQERRQDRGGARKPQRSNDQRGKDQRGSEQRGDQRGGSRQDAQRQGAQRQEAQGAEAKGGTLDVFAEFEAEPKTGDSARVARLDDIQLPHAEEEDAQDNNARRRRGRDRRDRKRRPNQRESQAYEEVDVADGDVLIPIAGVLDVLDNYAFVRTTGYLPGSSDVYVNLGMVRRYGLRRGDAVTGAVKQPREGETSSRQKFNALVAPERVNNSPAAESDQRPEFDALPAMYPQAFLGLGSESTTQKVVDVLAPLALGQRVLVSTDPGIKRLKFLTEVAQGIAVTHPDVHLMMVLIDERPEDATHMQRNIHGEVIASSFDRSGNDHTTVATLAIERAKRLVELGQDVVVVFDSLTALARAYHTSTNPSSRVLEHGLDASTVHSVKQVFGAGRNIENGGSLTLIATGVRGTDAGDFVLAELETTANAHVTLEQGDLEARVDPLRTYTRNLDAIFDVDELAPRIVLRRLLEERGSQDGAAWLEEQLGGKSASQFLSDSVKVTPREKAEIRRSFA